MIQPSNLLPNCAEGSLAKKDTFLGQVGLHGPDFESDTFGVSSLKIHNLLTLPALAFLNIGHGPGLVSGRDIVIVVYIWTTAESIHFYFTTYTNNNLWK